MLSSTQASPEGRSTSRMTPAGISRSANSGPSPATAWGRLRGAGAGTPQRRTVSRSHRSSPGRAARGRARPAAGPPRPADQHLQHFRVRPSASTTRCNWWLELLLASAIPAARANVSPYSPICHASFPGSANRRGNRPEWPAGRQPAGSAAGRGGRVGFLKQASRGYHQPWRGGLTRTDPESLYA